MMLLQQQQNCCLSSPRCSTGPKALRPGSAGPVPRTLVRQQRRPPSVARRVAQQLAPTQTADPADPARPSNGTEAQPQNADSAEQLNWLQAWYPVGSIDNLAATPGGLTKVQVLGRDYVAWQDKAGAWQLFVDRCPHRLATLSDGFVSAAGELTCAYHGWRFDSSGTCTSIPQALDATSAATACASKRSCVESFPTAVAGGLLWAWLDSGSPALAAATPVPLVPEFADESLVPEVGRFMTRDLPYSWDMFIENVLDPTHVDFAHHKIAGFDADAFTPLDLKLSEDRGAAGFTFQTLPQNPARRGAYIHFRPPALVTIQPGADPVPSEGRRSRGAADARPGSEDPNTLSGLVFYCYPMRPGWTRLIGGSWVSDKEGKPVKTFSLFANAMPVWLKHVLGFFFFAGDDVFLGAASRRFVIEGSSARKSYYCPTPADAAILKFRSWLDKHSGGAIPWPKHLQGDAQLLANLDLRPEEAMDRWGQHVAHCSHCQAAARKTDAVAAASAALALASLVAACLAASVLAAAALGAPAASPAWLLGAASAGSRVGAALPLLLLGGLAALVHLAASKVKALFHYVPFSRPTF